MADKTPATPPATNPAGTEGDQPAATQPPAASGATKDDNTVTLNKEDYQNLIASRDRANNMAQETQDWVTEQKVRTAIGQFLADNKDDYPDVEVDDLLMANGPDELPDLATKMQNRISKSAQDRLVKLQTATTPELSPKERRKQLADLQKSDDPKRFDKMLELQGIDKL